MNTLFSTLRTMVAVGAAGTVFCAATGGVAYGQTEVDLSNGPIRITTNGAEVVGTGTVLGPSAAYRVVQSGARPTTNTLTVDGVNCALELTELAVCVTGQPRSCAFAVDGEAEVVLTPTAGGTNVFASGPAAAGIRVGPSATLTVMAGGTLKATGGIGAAGIGGDAGAWTGRVRIEPGAHVCATAGDGAADIGAGAGGIGGDLVIRGGLVEIGTGAAFAGLGGGGGTFEQTGGTVRDVSRSPSGFALAFNRRAVTGGSLPVSIFCTGDISNNSAHVYGVTLGELEPLAPVSFIGLNACGTNEIAADAEGRVVLWLPAGDYAWLAEPATGEALAAPIRAVTVGEDGTIAISNAPLRITDFTNGTVTAWSPAALSADLLHTRYATDLTASEPWMDHPSPEGASPVFMHLKLEDHP